MSADRACEIDVFPPRLDSRTGSTRMGRWWVRGVLVLCLPSVLAAVTFGLLQLMWGASDPPGKAVLVACFLCAILGAVATPAALLLAVIGTFLRGIPRGGKACMWGGIVVAILSCVGLL